MILCRHCGAQITPDQNFCLDCGAAVTNSAPRSLDTLPIAAQLTSQTTARPISTLLIVLGLIATAAASIAVTVVLLRGGGGNQSQGAPSAVRPSDPSGASSPPPAQPRPTASSMAELRITPTASSSRTATSENSYEASNILDRSLQTAWVEGVGGPGIGQWIRCDFDREVKLRRIRIAPGYFKNSRIWLHNNRLARVTFYFSDGSTRPFTFPDRMEEQTLEVGGIRTRSVRMTIDDIYAGSTDTEDTPISQLAFEWEQ